MLKNSFVSHGWVCCWQVPIDNVKYGNCEILVVKYELISPFFFLIEDYMCP